MYVCSLFCETYPLFVLQSLLNQSSIFNQSMLIDRSTFNLFCPNRILSEKLFSSIHVWVRSFVVLCCIPEVGSLLYSFHYILFSYLSVTVGPTEPILSLILIFVPGVHISIKFFRLLLRLSRRVMINEELISPSKKRVIFYDELLL